MAMPEGLPASRFPVLNFPNIVRLTANDKDFSLALEMTIRESDVSQSPVTASEILKKMRKILNSS